MRRFSRSISCLLIGVILILSLNASTLHVNAETGIVIDGYYDDWDDKHQGFYKFNGGGNSGLENSHIISFYRDWENLYLFITFASNFYDRFADSGYEFVDNGANKATSFYITFVGGEKITGSTNDLEDGNYSAEIRHGASSLSGSVVSNAEVVFSKRSNDINNQVEIKIPLVALQEQNPNIDIDDFNKLRFMNDWLTNKKIEVAGTSTLPIIGIGLCIGVAAILPTIKKRRKQVES